MFTLFHFGFELVKIGALATVYSFLFYCLYFILKEVLGKKKPGKPKFGRFYLIVYILLFAYSFTYYGNHGLGDESHIPLGYYQTIDATDGYAFFTPKNLSKTLSVDSFLVIDHKVCIASGSTYYIYNLSSGKEEKFDSKISYEQYAAHSSLPPTCCFKKYYDSYNEYWNGWRFWF